MKFQDFSDPDFYKKLINSLPGVFYLYELVGDKIFLKLWNENHVKSFGYSNEELLNMTSSDFLSEKENKKVNKAIEQTFTRGTAQVRAIITSKSGKQVPYLLEAFSFVDNGRHFLMGVGIDITYQLKVERNLIKANVEQEMLEQKKVDVTDQLETKKRELVTTAVESAKTNKIIKSTINQLNKLISNHSQNELYQELIDIRKNLEMQINVQDNWEMFKLRFEEVHKEFFSKIMKKYPGLTRSELKFCAYLNIHLSSDQLCSILNVSPNAIKKTRYRILKKLGLQTKDSLEKSIHNL